MLNDLPAHLYLFTRGSLPLPPSFCIILCAGLLVFVLFPSLQLLHQFVILSAFLCSLLGTEYPPSARKHSLQGPLSNTYRCWFSYMKVWQGRINWDICYSTIYIEKGGVTPVLYLRNSEILGNCLLVQNFCKSGESVSVWPFWTVQLNLSHLTLDVCSADKYLAASHPRLLLE